MLIAYSEGALCNNYKLFHGRLAMIYYNCSRITTINYFKIRSLCRRAYDVVLNGENKIY